MPPKKATTNGETSVRPHTPLLLFSSSLIQPLTSTIRSSPGKVPTTPRYAYPSPPSSSLYIAEVSYILTPLDSSCSSSRKAATSSPKNIPRYLPRSLVRPPVSRLPSPSHLPTSHTPQPPPPPKPTQHRHNLRFNPQPHLRAPRQAARPVRHARLGASRGRGGPFCEEEEKGRW
jgi:hypothetical protein